MAKLAVLMFVPNRCTTHWPLSGGRALSLMRALPKEGRLLGGGRCLWLLDPHGVTPSERRTPLSRASCSSVIGMNDPDEQQTLSRDSRQWTWNNQSYRPHRLQRPRQPSHSYTIQRVPSDWSNGCLLQGTEGRVCGLELRNQTPCWADQRPSIHRQLQRTE